MSNGDSEGPGDLRNMHCRESTLGEPPLYRHIITKTNNSDFYKLHGQTLIYSNFSEPNDHCYGRVIKYYYLLTTQQMCPENGELLHLCAHNYITKMGTLHWHTKHY